jgi:2-polyprenyl-6-methoxyphenol hydroxylase-like FAD-dependent oxidoreductase
MVSKSSESAQTPEKPQNNVLVVGAGPVGLAIALRLALAGIVVDAMLGEEPRAVAYYVSAPIALDKMGVIPDMEKAEFVSEGFCWRKPIRGDGRRGYTMGDVIARLPIPRDTKESNGFGGVLYLPQPELTQILIRESNRNCLCHCARLCDLEPYYQSYLGQ